MTREQAIAVAKSVLDKRPRSYVEAAFQLARFVLDEGGYLTLRVEERPDPPSP